MMIESSNNWKAIGGADSKFDEVNKSDRQTIYCIVGEKCRDRAELSFYDILLDERYAAGGFYVSSEVFYECGGISGLPIEGRNYELLLRLAKKFKVVGIYDSDMQESDMQEPTITACGFKTDAYILSLYMKEIKDAGLFDTILKSLVLRAQQSALAEKDMQYLEDMLGKKEAYQKLYRSTCPILILKGKNFCYNILNDIADGFAEAFEVLGKQVEKIDLSTENGEELSGIVGNTYQAVIGFQSFWTGIYLKETHNYLADLVCGPKLELVYDHPFWFPKQLLDHCRNIYVLTHDENYVEYIKNYGNHIDGCFLLPPSGRRAEAAQDGQILPDKELDVVFLGTYNNYRTILAAIYHCPREIRRIAARYLWYLRRNLNQPAEDAFKRMQNDYGITGEQNQFIQSMYQMGNVCQCLMYYYREKIIDTLLTSGTDIHVYGESWKQSPFSQSPHLICHEEVSAEESGEVLQKAKISLNILAWHKGGCNERIINSMLAKAAVVTDKSSYLEKHFVNGKNICYFELDHLEELPYIIDGLLADEKLRQTISAAGFEKANGEYTFNCGAERILNILEEL